MPFTHPMKPHYPAHFCLCLSLILFSCNHKPNIIEKKEVVSSFEKSFGSVSDDEGRSIIRDNNNLLILGSTKGMKDSQGDFYLVKTSLDGELVWEKSLGWIGDDFGKCIAAVNDGYILGGDIHEGNGDLDIGIIKVDSAGKELWKKNFGGAMDDQVFDIVTSSDKLSFYIVGRTKSSGSGDFDVWVIKSDLNGNSQWQKTYGGVANDGGSGLAFLPDGNFLIYGYTESSGAGGRDLWLITADANGTEISSETFGGAGYEEPHNILRTITGNYLLCAHTASIDQLHNLFAIKVNSFSVPIFEKEVGGDMHDGGEAVIQGKSTDFLFTGYTSSFGNDNQAYFVKMKSNGDLILQEGYGGSGYERGYDIVETDLGYVIVGETNSIGKGGKDLYLVKIAK